MKTKRMTYAASIGACATPLGPEMMKLGRPTAVYSTTITKSNENKPLPKAVMPRGLEKRAFPKDFWIHPASGEFLMGVFKDDQGRDAVFIANQNSQAPQPAEGHTEAVQSLHGQAVRPQDIRVESAGSRRRRREFRPRQSRRRTPAVREIAGYSMQRA